MAVISATGVIISYNAQTVGGVQSFTGLQSGQAADKDRTTLASTAKEFAPGLEDNGEISLQLLRDNDDVGQAALLTARDAQTTNEMIITLPTSTLNVATFQGYVKSISSDGAIDGDIVGTAIVRITGSVVWS